MGDIDIEVDVEGIDRTIKALQDGLMDGLEDTGDSLLESGEKRSEDFVAGRRVWTRRVKKGFESKGRLTSSHTYRGSILNQAPHARVVDLGLAPEGEITGSDPSVQDLMPWVVTNLSPAPYDGDSSPGDYNSDDGNGGDDDDSGAVDPAESHDPLMGANKLSEGESLTFENDRYSSTDATVSERLGDGYTADYRVTVDSTGDDVEIVYDEIITFDGKGTRLEDVEYGSEVYVGKEDKFGIITDTYDDSVEVSLQGRGVLRLEPDEFEKAKSPVGLNLPPQGTDPLMGAKNLDVGDNVIVSTESHGTIEGTIHRLGEEYSTVWWDYEIEDDEVQFYEIYYQDVTFYEGQGESIDNISVGDRVYIGESNSTAKIIEVRDGGDADGALVKYDEDGFEDLLDLSEFVRIGDGSSYERDDSVSQPADITHENRTVNLSKRPEDFDVPSDAFESDQVKAGSIGDGTNVFWKSHHDPDDTSSSNVGNIRNEVVWSRVQERLGYNLGPRSRVETIDDGTTGTLQEYVEGEVLSTQMWDGGYGSPQDYELDRVQLLRQNREWAARTNAIDYLVDNGDRHSSNIQVDENGNPRAIDNGGSYFVDVLNGKTDKDDPNGKDKLTFLNSLWDYDSATDTEELRKETEILFDNTEDVLRNIANDEELRQDIIKIVADVHGEDSKYYDRITKILGEQDSSEHILAEGPNGVPLWERHLNTVREFHESVYESAKDPFDEHDPLMGADKLDVGKEVTITTDNYTARDGEITEVFDDSYEVALYDFDGVVGATYYEIDEYQGQGPDLADISEGDRVFVGDRNDFGDVRNVDDVGFQVVYDTGEFEALATHQIELVKDTEKEFDDSIDEAPISNHDPELGAKDLQVGDKAEFAKNGDVFPDATIKERGDNAGEGVDWDYKIEKDDVVYEIDSKNIKDFPGKGVDLTNVSKGDKVYVGPEDGFGEVTDVTEFDATIDLDEGGEEKFISSQFEFANENDDDIISIQDEMDDLFGSLDPK